MLVSMLLAIVCSVVAPEPPAKPESPKIAEALPEDQRDATLAREAWAKGVEAYGQARLDDAIGYFEQTFRYSGSPGPLFSLGQAHRHAFEEAEKGSAEAERHRILAARAYTKYLELEPDGKRALEAERHLTQLVELSALELQGPDPARISVSTPIVGAKISIDGGPPQALPFSTEVEPGTHEIAVTAAGYHPWVRKVEVDEDSTLSPSPELRPLDANLTVTAMPGAVLYLDGRRVASLPATEPLAVTPGRHQIGVARSGRSLFVREVELGNGESRHVDAPLEVTGQRRVAFAAIGVGAAASVTAIVLGGLAGKAQADAKPLIEAYETGSLQDFQRAELQALESERDRFRTAAIATGAGGVAAIGVGLVLLFTDKPPVASQLHELPAVTVRPSLRGVALEGRF